MSGHERIVTGAMVAAVLLTGCSAQPGRLAVPVGLEGTQWVLTEMHGASLLEDTTIALTFFEGDYLQGHAGCNSYGADYSSSGNDFHIPELHSTGQECDTPEAVMRQETSFLDALRNAAVYGVIDDRLQFQNAAGEPLLTFTAWLPHSMDPALEGTEWVLTSLRGADLLEGSQITLNLGEGELGGFTGCNRYGGELVAADGGTLEIGSLWQTEAECRTADLQDQERAFVEMLRGAVAYQLMEGRLEIVSAAGETTLVFAGEEDTAMNPGDLIGTDWLLLTMDGATGVEGSTITLAFDSDREMSGNAGCGEFEATYEARGDTIKLLSFHMMDTNCQGDDALAEQEGRYMAILGWASAYRLSEGRLVISSARGEVLVFAPRP